MADDTFVLRDAQGTEYRIAVADGHVTVNDVTLTVEPLDGAAMRVGQRDQSESGGNPSRVAHAVAAEDAPWVFADGAVFTFEVERAGQRRKSADAAGSLTAPMPATVRRVEIQPGQAVRRGDILIVLEAMKMELPVRAPADGTVARVNCREGELVPAGYQLVELQP